MTDKFGPRMSGSVALEKAIDYIQEEMKADGLDAYTTEAEVPFWHRGKESATLLSPREINLPMLGLGGSVGTNGLITADVIVVADFDEFESLPEEAVKGKIVVFAQKFTSYGETVKYRLSGASVASRKGAVAALINSVTPFSMQTPHTGQQVYDDDVKRIPAACITLEDAELLTRLYKRGEPIKIALSMEAKNLGMGQSLNLIGELKGHKKNPNQSVVIVSGHLDSWDVGVGAMDDGGGAYIARYATTFLSDMGFRPKRTIRSILWTGEEQGFFGAIAYMEQHKATEEKEFNLLMESDGGTFEPLGMDFSGNAMAKCIFNEVVKLLGPLNATQTGSPQENGPDIEQWTRRGFNGASLMNKNDKYFWYHHTQADSMLVEDTTNLDKGAAVFAVTAYVIADLSIDLPKDAITKM